MRSLEYVGLAIIHQPYRDCEDFGKVLIVRKNEPMPSGRKLTWGFPSSRLLPGKTIEQSLTEGTKEQTGLDVEILKPVFAWLHPDQDYNANITYFEAMPKSWPQEIKLKEEKILEAKFVDPKDVISHFTTRNAPEIGIYLSEFIVEPFEYATS